MTGPRNHPHIGIFGGTFNPIHVGHLRAAEEVTEVLGLERMLFVPSARPPHKRAGDDAIAPIPERLAWVKAAVADNPRFQVDPLEIERAGPSYSVETVRTLRDRFGAGALVFVLGRDAFQELGTWREPATLLALADVAVMTRPPTPEGSLREWVPAPLAGALRFEADGRAARHCEAGTRVALVEITALDVSASDVRARLRAGRSVRYLLPDAVREIIEASGAYAEADRARTRQSAGSGAA